MIDHPPQTEFHYQAALYFLECGHYLFCNYEGKQKSSKFIAAPDVTAAFSGQEYEFGWFPAGVVRCGRNARGDWFVYSAPAQKVLVTLLDDAAIMIPIPRTVLLGAGKDFYIWALKTDHFDPGSQAYAAPFPNIDGNGKICWGNNKPPAAHPKNARSVWELFFASPFNKHLANNKSQAHPMNVTEGLRALEGKKRYPLGDLINQRVVIGSQIQQILEKGR